MGGKITLYGFYSFCRSGLKPEQAKHPNSPGSKFSHRLKNASVANKNSAKKALQYTLAQLQILAV
jgi:hypothetical protein